MKYQAFKNNLGNVTIELYCPHCDSRIQRAISTMLTCSHSRYSKMQKDDIKAEMMTKLHEHIDTEHKEKENEKLQTS